MARAHLISSGPATRPRYSLTLIAAVPLGMAVAAIWYLSPLAFGFAQWPGDAAQRDRAQFVYQLSFFVGIPLLLAAPLAANVLFALGFRRAAFTGLVMAAAAFALCAGGLLLVLK